MTHAASLAPSIGREAFLQGYAVAFGGVLLGLAALTVALAAVALSRCGPANAPRRQTLRRAIPALSNDVVLR